MTVTLEQLIASGVNLDALLAWAVAMFNWFFNQFIPWWESYGPAGSYADAMAVLTAVRLNPNPKRKGER